MHHQRIEEVEHELWMIMYYILKRSIVPKHLGALDQDTDNVIPKIHAICLVLSHVSFL